MRTPRERLDRPLGDIPYNDPRPWRKEIPFGAESEMRRIPFPATAPPPHDTSDLSFWNTAGPRRNWSLAAGAGAERLEGVIAAEEHFPEDASGVLIEYVFLSLFEPIEIHAVTEN